MRLLASSIYIHYWDMLRLRYSMYLLLWFLKLLRITWNSSPNYVIQSAYEIKDEKLTRESSHMIETLTLHITEYRVTCFMLNLNLNSYVALKPIWVADDLTSKKTCHIVYFWYRCYGSIAWSMNIFKIDISEIVSSCEDRDLILV